jgi:HK97 family phage major capsid protein
MLKELYEKRMSLVTQARTLHDKYKDDWTEERQAEWQRIMDDADKVTSEIRRIEQMQAIEDENRRATEPEGRIVPPTTPQGEEPEGSDSPIIRATSLPEYRTAFRDWLRTGREASLRSMNLTTDTEGGYFAPTEFHRQVVAALNEFMPYRQYCTVLPTSADRDIPIADQNGQAYWVGEEGDRMESDETVGQRSLRGYPCARLQKVGRYLVQDSVFSIEEFLSTQFGRAFADLEEEAFTSGNGVGRPTGFIVDAEVGKTADEADTFDSDEVIDFYFSLKAPYRRRAIWVMNDDTLKEIAKLKDGSGRYVWQLSFVPGQPDTILGRPVVPCNSMDTIEAEAKIMAFGDFAFYWIADRGTPIVQRLNELYAGNGQIGFLMERRVDGKLVVDEAIKVFQMAASGS